MAAHRAAPGLIFWGFSVTFMAIDWVLSINPHWFSTMFGLLFIAGQGLSSMAFLITLMVLLSLSPAACRTCSLPAHLHDLGKFLLAMVMVWAYFSFSQLLIIWAGNLPEEIPWYLERLSGGWQYVGLALVLGHFALPFALLLSRDLKRNFKLLASMRRLHSAHAVCGPVLAGGARFHQGRRFSLSWMDFAAPVGVGGIWLAYFLTQLEKRPLMPMHDPASGGGSGTWPGITGRAREQEVPLADIERPPAHQRRPMSMSGRSASSVLRLFLTCIAVLFLIVGVFRYFQVQEQARQAPLPAGMNVDARGLPPAPRLQDAPMLDLPGDARRRGPDLEQIRMGGSDRRGSCGFPIDARHGSAGATGTAVAAGNRSGNRQHGQRADRKRTGAEDDRAGGPLAQ